MKAFESGGKAKEMKSLVLQADGAQYPTKNVALWSNHPLYAGIKVGDEIDVELDEKDSTTENPHKPGTYYKNRSVKMPGAGGGATVDLATGAALQSIERKIDLIMAHLEVKDVKAEIEEVRDLEPEDVPF